MRLYKFIDDPNGNPVLESFPVDQSEDKYQTVFWVTGEEMSVTALTPVLTCAT